MPWDRQCLHWPLAFPEVFLPEGRCGFDSMIANPPFRGGQHLTGDLGQQFREHLVEAVAEGTRGSADLVAYFLLRMCDVGQYIGTLATNTVSQADTRQVGLDRLVASGWTVYRAVKTAPWPGEAGVEVAKIWMSRSVWTGRNVLDGQVVRDIAPSLEVSGESLVRRFGLLPALGVVPGVNPAGSWIHTVAR